MNDGYIKLHRKLRENPIYRESKAVHCWVECLLRASYKPKEVYLKRQKIKLNPGQFVMGREEFGRSIGISGSTAWYWINRFYSDNMVDIKKTSKGSIITILNWENYQAVDITVDNKQTTNEQQKNTTKNIKNIKNIKNKEKDKEKEKKKEVAKQVSLFQNEIDSLIEKHGKDIYEKAIDKLSNYKQSKGKKYKSDYAAINLWVIKAVLEDELKAKQNSNKVYKEPNKKLKW